MLNKALLGVDVQKEFTHDPAYIKQIKALILDHPYYEVIGTYFKNQKDSTFVKRLMYFDCMYATKSLIACDKLVETCSYGLPIETIEYLKQFSEVNVIGMDSDASIMAICYQLFDADIDFYVLSKYCRSSGGEIINKSAIEILRRNFGPAVI